MAGNERSSVGWEDLRRLRMQTADLGTQTEKLTKELQQVMAEATLLVKKRRARVKKLQAAEADEMSVLITDTKKKVKLLRKDAAESISTAKDRQHVHYEKIEKEIKEKGCSGPKPQQQQQQQQQVNAMYDNFGVKPSTPPPDPCQDSAGSADEEEEEEEAEEEEEEEEEDKGEEEDDEEEHKAKKKKTSKKKKAKKKTDPTTRCRQEEVVRAFKHSWNGYKKHAWGWDELMPLSQRGKNWARGIPKSFGLTIHDSLSTMLLMGLDDEFQDALKWIETEFDPNLDFPMSAFESMIRIVGGTLSAYELSGEKHSVLLKTARAVADRIMFAYNTSSGIPHSTVNFATHQHGNPPWSGGSSVLSEFGTVQLELRTLTYHTGDATYDQRATWIMDVVNHVAPPDFLCPTYMNTANARWTSDHITLGALGDSFFEYLLKQYLLTGKTEERYRTMYKKAADGIMKRLVQKGGQGLSYIAEFKRGAHYHKMDHLACFAAGMLALGASELDRDSGEDASEVLRVAEEVTETCYMMYHKTATGVSPEMVEFRNGEMFIGGRASYYLLRPETAESLFYLWRLTKKQKYRQWGWEVFLSIKRWCKVDSGGYAGLRNVEFVPPQQDDLQQSFWLAETLKYLYLLFSDDSKLDLTKWVLNTEAHPLKIRKRNPLDIWPAAIRELRAKDLPLPLDDKILKYSVPTAGDRTNINDPARILSPYTVNGAAVRDTPDTPVPKKTRKVRKKVKVKRHKKHKHDEEEEGGGEEEGSEEDAAEENEGEGEEEEEAAAEEEKKKKKKHHKHHHKHRHHKKKKQEDEADDTENEGEVDA